MYSIKIAVFLSTTSTNTKTRPPRKVCCSDKSGLQRKSAVLYQLCHFSSKRLEEKWHNWYSTALFLCKTSGLSGRRSHDCRRVIQYGTFPLQRSYLKCRSLRYLSSNDYAFRLLDYTRPRRKVRVRTGHLEKCAIAPRRLAF